LCIFRLLEEYIDDKYEVILYERFFNFEIACGSYFAHNSEFARRFLMQLADSEKTLPASFHGRDNGAIHFVLLETAYGEFGNDTIGCRKLWENSRDGADLYAAEVCARLLLNREKVNSWRIKITRKGEGWVRDAFLTWSRWSRGHDFMIHGWKADNLINETSEA
uniref:RNase H domain-containing protein n=1 Tax=Toxocara canis TaxID=6265 RepID=A0A183V7P4_TOXCA